MIKAKITSKDGAVLEQDLPMEIHHLYHDVNPGLGATGARSFSHSSSEKEPHLAGGEPQGYNSG